MDVSPGMKSMTTFEDLISDLKNESLLDEWFNSPFDRDYGLAGSNQTSNSLQFESIFPTSPVINNRKKLELPDANVLQSLKASNKIQVANTNSSLPQQKIIFTENGKYPQAYKTRSNKVKKSGSKAGNKKGNFCNNCIVKVAPWKFHCPYCHKRLVNDLYYYSLIMFGFVIFTIILMLFVTSKNYK